MQDVYLDHLSEDVLERYYFRTSSGEESEIVDNHVLVCEDCIARLEDIKDYVAVLRVASTELALEAPLRAEKQGCWRERCFTPRNLAWGSAAACLFVAMAFVPGRNAHTNGTMPIPVSLSAWRGVDVASVTTGRPLHLRLNSTDLPAGAVMAQLVDSRGREIWHGPTSVRDESVAVSIPALSRRDNYFVRIYAPGSKDKLYGDLLREFGFRAK